MEVGQKDRELLREEVLKIFRYFSGIRKEIDDSSEVYHDLGFYGDDVDELLLALHKKFRTDWSALPLDQYFASEGEMTGASLLKLFGWRDKRRGSFTFGRLVDAVSASKWEENERCAGHPYSD